MGTHGRRGFKRLLLGSVTETVLREAPCPVLTVPSSANEASSEAVTFKRILCPIDFSPSALQALGFALDLARQADGRVTLMHVVEWLAEEEPQALAHFNVPEYRRYLAADAGDRLRPWWRKSRGRGSRSTTSSFRDARIVRSFTSPKRYPLTLLLWVRRVGVALDWRCLDRPRSRWCGAPHVQFLRCAGRD